jgi:hypothetical protein
VPSIVRRVDWRRERAYLHGALEEELYMRVPEGIDDGEYAGKVLNLDRALYGLKQAGRV